MTECGATHSEDTSGESKVTLNSWVAFIKLHYMHHRRIDNCIKLTMHACSPKLIGIVHCRRLVSKLIKFSCIIVFSA